MKHGKNNFKEWWADKMSKYEVGHYDKHEAILFVAVIAFVAFFISGVSYN